MSLSIPPRVISTSLAITLSTVLLFCWPLAASAVEPTAASEDLTIRSAQVRHLEDLDLLVFEVKVAGQAGATVPNARGQQHGAPVLGYVFPTNLKPEQVGFAAVEGIVALAATAHPDFDDTPLWDENGDRDYTNDGVIFHSHWVVLVEDPRVPGGLAVRGIDGSEADPVAAGILPPTAPGMPLFLDSPGFSVLLRGKTLKILVPAQRIGGETTFRFDAVVAYMEVNTEDEERPTLGVYKVYSVLSGDLSLPYRVKR